MKLVVGADRILTVTLNPSIDITFGKNGAVTFSPSAKVAYGLTETVDVGVEYYADNLPFKRMYGVTQQPNTAYLVMDAKLDKTSLNVSFGICWNSFDASPMRNVNPF